LVILCGGDTFSIDAAWLTLEGGLTYRFIS
jgi:hypothetical protein